jgi:hypothetical protein
VKIRIVVPDHRNVPGISGTTRTKGAVTRAGMRPSVTIGSENTIRISFTSDSADNSPDGPPLTTVNVWGEAVWAAAEVESSARRSTISDGMTRSVCVMRQTCGTTTDSRAGGSAETGGEQMRCGMRSSGSQMPGALG